MSLELEIVGLTPAEVEQAWQLAIPDRPWVKKRLNEPVPGREHQFNERLAIFIYHLAAAGLPAKSIANAVGLSWPTIYKYYKEPYRDGMAEAERQMASVVWRLAHGAQSEMVQLKAAQFWLQTRHHWRQDSLRATSLLDDDVEEKPTTIVLAPAAPMLPIEPPEVDEADPSETSGDGPDEDNTKFDPPTIEGSVVNRDG